MIFKAKLVGRILAGQKTQTRRPVKDEECRYQPGRTYAVQSKRGGREICRIKIEAVRQEFLHEITPLDALAEGFRSRQEFLDYWFALYREGPGIPGNPEYPVLIPVWVIGFSLSTEHTPRFLHRDSSHGYTHDTRLALPHEPEAVPASFQIALAEDAHQSDERRRRFSRAALTERYEDARQRALANGIDVTRQEMAFERIVRQMESKAGKVAA